MEPFVLDFTQLGQDEIGVVRWPQSEGDVSNSDWSHWNWCQIQWILVWAELELDVRTHLLVGCRCCLTESSSDKSWCGGRRPPQRSQSPGSSSSGPAIRNCFRRSAQSKYILSQTSNINDGEAQGNVNNNNVIVLFLFAKLYLVNEGPFSCSIIQPNC